MNTIKPKKKYIAPQSEVVMLGLREPLLDADERKWPECLLVVVSSVNLGP